MAVLSGGKPSALDVTSFLPGAVTNTTKHSNAASISKRPEKSSEDRFAGVAGLTITGANSGLRSGDPVL